MTGVLLVRLSAMGDVVQGLGAAASLRRAQPDRRITFVTQATFAPLVVGAPGVDRVVAFDRRGGWRALWRLRRELRRERYDVALDLQGNWKSALVARLSGARECVGMAAAWRQEPGSRWLLQRTVACAAMPHPARVAWELVRSIAPGCAFVPPTLVAAPSELASERAALAALGIDTSAPFDVVVVTDPADPRALRPQVVAALAPSVPGAPRIDLLGPAEAHVPARPGVPCLRHGVGEARRLVALGQLVACAGGRVVGPDQGATHVLAAAGATCVVAFGAQDPRRTAPPGVRAVVHREPPVCAPCRQARCTHADGPVCMQFDPDHGRVVDCGLPGG